MCESLQELAVAEPALWHRSPVIPATPTLGPGTAAERGSDSWEIVPVKPHVHLLAGAVMCSLGEHIYLQRMFSSDVL